MYQALSSLKGPANSTSTGLFPNQIVDVPFTESDETLISDIIKKKELYISVLLEYEYKIDKITSLPGVYQAIFIVKLTITGEDAVSSHSVNTFEERITLD